MNSREHLGADIDTITSRSKLITWIVWSVAVFVMVYGTPIVYEFLTAHDVPGGIAWMLSIAADGGLCVGLVATPVLAAHGVPAGWVGTLRWVAGFITWALQTAGSWTHPGGVDGVGVAAHTAGPVLLFFVVEAASYFQRKIGEVIVRKQRELAAAEKVDGDRRAHLAETEAALRTAKAELTAARAEITTLGERLTDNEAHRADDRHTAALTAERQAAEIAGLRKAFTEQSVKHTEELAKLERDIKAKYSEKFAKLQAENGTVNLNRYRKDRTGAGSPPPTNRPAMSDEDAVQAMYAKHSDPDHEWSQNSVRTLTGAGFGRIPNLITAWREYALREAGGEAAVNQ